MTTELVKKETTKTIATFADMEKAAEAIAKSGLFGLKTKEQVLALGMIAEAEGRPFASAARDYHVISFQGAVRPSLRADAMLARFQESGGSVKWITCTDEQVTAVFSHPQGGTLEVTWDSDRVKQAGLIDKDIHRKYPRQMKRARVISEGVRAVYAPCVYGFYSPEEVIDTNEPPIPEKDVTAQVEVRPPEKGKPAAAVKEAKEKLKAPVEKKKTEPDPAPPAEPPAAPEPPAEAPEEKPDPDLVPEETAATGDALTEDKVKKIEGAFAPFKITLEDLEYWRDIPSDTWTESVRKELLRLLAAAKAGKDVKGFIEQIKTKAGYYKKSK